MAATVAPTTGVHSPATRRSPNAASDVDGSAMCNGESLHILVPMTRTQPTTRRMTIAFETPLRS